MPSIRVPFSLEATPAMGMIDKLVGGMKRLTGAIGKTGVVAIAAGVGIGIFTVRYLSKATKEAVKFQTEMIGLRKILGERPAMAIGEAIGDLSKEMPLARKELINVAETAARLGVRGTSNIIQFTKTMAMMGVATNVSAEEAADALARVAKQTNTPIAKLQNLGSVINELSNTMATSSSEIIAAVRRSAPELSRLGIPVEDIAALAASLNTVSESATRAGTRLRRFGQALSDPNKIEVFASALEITTRQFRQMRKDDPTKLIQDIIAAMANGGVAADRLATGLDARVRLALAALAQVQGDVTTALIMGRDEMENNNSLYDEYSRILNTVVSKQLLLNNRITETRREIGENMLPALTLWLTALNNIAAKINVIVNTPMEGIMTKSMVDRLEAASEALQHTALSAEELQKLAKLSPTDLIDMSLFTKVSKREAKEFRLELEAMTRDAGIFGREFAFALVALVEANAEAGRSFEDTRNDANGLWGSFVQIGQAVEENAEGTIEASRALRGLNRESIKGLRFGPGMIHHYRELGKNLGQAKVDTDALRLAEEMLAKEMPNAAMVDFSAELEEQILGLTATEAELLRLAPAYLEAVEAIATFDDTGEGNVEHIIKWKKGIDVLIATVVRLGEEETLATKRARTAKTYYDNFLRGIENRKQKTIAYTRALELERLELTLGTRAKYEQKLIDDEIKQEDIDKLMRKWDEVEVERVLAAQREDAARQEQQIQDRIKRRMDLFDLSNVESRFRLLEKVVDGLTDSTMEFFEAMITGSGNAGEAFINMIKSIVAEILRAHIMKFFMKLLGPGGALGDLFSIGDGLDSDKIATSSSNGIGMASGGQIRRGQLAIVGEKGPELFVPNVGGTVVPNNKMNSGMQETIILNNHFTINALDGANVREVLAKEQDFLTGLSIDKIQRHRALKR